MKKIFAATLVSLCALSAYADEAPRTEPSQPMEMSEEVVNTSKLLLHPVVQKCAKLLHSQEGLRFSLNGVTRQGLNPGHTSYVFSGTMFEGREAVGLGKLHVEEKTVQREDGSSSHSIKCDASMTR